MKAENLIRALNEPGDRTIRAYVCSDVYQRVNVSGVSSRHLILPWGNVYYDQAIVANSEDHVVLVCGTQIVGVLGADKMELEAEE